MDNDQALFAFQRIPASTSSERLRAARFLVQNATNAHRIQLSKIREAEPNSWVRRALEQALQRLDKSSASPRASAVEEVREAPLDARLHEELHAQAIEETSALFLHELRPLVGLLDEAADGEIDRYACSRTKALVGRVKSFLNAIETLRKASAAPVAQEFDLTDLVARIAADEVSQGRATLESLAGELDGDADGDDDAEGSPQFTLIKLSLARQDPIITTGDPTLVEMSVANALRNAIEAVMNSYEDDQSDVILNWGATDTDNWIVVLDKGCGLPSGWDRLKEPGTSTKKSQGHLGMGLPIAQRAIESMQGSIRLTPRDGGGVQCEIRWPKRDIGL